MNRASAPAYDLFKLIVTILLLLILIVMLLRGCATAPASAVPVESSQEPTQRVGSVAQTEAVPPVAEASTVTPSPAPSVTPTPLPPTPKATSELPSPTAAVVKGTPVSTPGGAATKVTSQPVESVSCETIVPSRLAVGQTARVVERLNVREAASITAAILQTNPVNTQVEIIGGPVCTPAGKHAYLWWQIRLASGVEGWSAEAPLNEATYLLEPIQ
jgi:hypothetical protein